MPNIQTAGGAGQASQDDSEEIFDYFANYQFNNGHLLRHPQTRTRMIENPAVSLCMLVRNEERNLPRCLDSVAGIPREILIVDTNSTDRTREIASAYVATVVNFDFAFVDFAAARNYGLGLASGQWILVLDADEALNPASADTIRALVAQNANAGYYFEHLNRQPEGIAPTVHYAVRLFPNRPEYRYRGRVHETIDAAILAGGGRLSRSAVRIRHDFASDPEARRRRNIRYIKILQEEITANPADDSRLDFLVAEYHQLGMFAEATAVAELIARLRPLDPAAHLHAGVYHLLYQPDRKRARADFLEALRLKPGDPEAQSFLEMMNEQEKQNL